MDDPLGRHLVGVEEVVALGEQVHDPLVVLCGCVEVFCLGHIGVLHLVPGHLHARRYSR